MNFDLLLKGGEVVTEAGVVTADVGVRDGLITAIGRYLSSDRLCPVYDVRGKWVLPAFVELYGSGDGQLELSKRAAVAGVSLFVSVVTPKPWESPDQTVKRVAAERTSAWVDYAYAVRVLAGQLPTYEALKEAQRQGLAYLLVSLSPRTDGLGLHDEELFTLLERAKNAGISVAVWLEHQGFARTLTRPTFRALKGADTAVLHTYSAPGELVQAARAIALADACGARICLCGVTNEQTMALAAGRHQVMGFAQSLLLSSAVYGRRRGRWYRAQPPLRSKDVVKALQKRFFANPRSLVAFAGGLPPSPALKAWRFPSDHLAAPLAALPGAAQALLGRLIPKKKPGSSKQIHKAARLMSRTPFAFAGYAAERGQLSIGAVADITVIAPTERSRLGPPRPKSSDELNPFMGLTGLALPALVFNRGHLVAEAGKLAGDKPLGTLAIPFALR